MSLEQEKSKALAFAERALTRCNELEQALQDEREAKREYRDKVDALEQRVTDLEKEKSIGEVTIDARRLKVDERAIVCIQTVYNQAKRRERAGELPTGSMDYNGADTATGGVLDRRQLIDALKRAESIVGDPDIVWYEKEPRSSQRNSRLIIDLREGSLPSHIIDTDVAEGFHDL